MNYVGVKIHIAPLQSAQFAGAHTREQKNRKNAFPAIEDFQCMKKSILLCYS